MYSLMMIPHRLSYTAEIRIFSHFFMLVFSPHCMLLQLRLHVKTEASQQVYQTTPESKQIKRISGCVCLIFCLTGKSGAEGFSLWASVNCLLPFAYSLCTDPLHKNLLWPMGSLHCQKILDSLPVLCTTLAICCEGLFIPWHEHTPTCLLDFTINQLVRMKQKVGEKTQLLSIISLCVALTVKKKAMIWV